MRVLIGVIIGLSLAGLLFFFSDTIISDGLPFVAGFLTAVITVTILTILVLNYFKVGISVSKKDKSLKNDGREEFNGLIKYLLPNVGEKQTNTIRKYLKKYIEFRGILLNVQIILSLFLALGGILGSLILLKQNKLLEDQNIKIGIQNNLAESQNNSLEKQNTLVTSQILLLEAQNESIDRQNSILIDDGKRLDRQNFLIGRQVDESTKEVNLLKSQNKLIKIQDSLLMEELDILRNQNPRGSSGSFVRFNQTLDNSLKSLLNELQLFTKSGRNGNIPDYIVNKISNFALECSSYYDYNSSKVDYSNSLSPEKGKLLQYIANQKYSEKNLSKIFSNVDFSFTLLIEGDLSNCNLSGANLIGSSLELCNLENSNLSHVNLSYSNLCGANMKDVYLQNTNFNYSYMGKPKYICDNLVFRVSENGETNYFVASDPRGKIPNNSCVTTYLSSTNKPKFSIEGTSLSGLQINKDFKEHLDELGILISYSEMSFKELADYQDINIIIWN